MYNKTGIENIIEVNISAFVNAINYKFYQTLCCCSTCQLSLKVDFHLTFSISYFYF